MTWVDGLIAAILADAEVDYRDDCCTDIQYNLDAELHRHRLPWLAEEVLPFSRKWHEAGYCDCKPSCYRAPPPVEHPAEMRSVIEMYKKLYPANQVKQTATRPSVWSSILKVDR